MGMLIPSDINVHFDEFRVVIEADPAALGFIQTQINHAVQTIMSAISTYAAKAKAHQDKIDAGIAGLTEDIQNLSEQIAQIQNSAGTLSTEDQAALDAADAAAQAAADKLEALDALTPPKPPTA